jgi:hypothetical protein
MIGSRSLGVSDDIKQEKPKKRRGHQRSQLKVVFDTNALYVKGSASDLVQQEIVNLITESKYPDLDILWFLPEVVRHERQYQMQVEALNLRRSINKIERLLGHNLALTDQTLLDHVAIKINDKERELGLQEIKVDNSKVDWSAVITAATYRLPPFSTGEKEKGFRDAIIVESFLQLVADSPKTPKVCRVVLITSDELLMQAVKERISSLPNASVLSSIEELKGLINTLISNVGEEFIATVKPKAARMFFVTSAEQDTLYYKEKLDDQIKKKFKSELTKHPEGTTFRSDGTWFIGKPNFSRKDGKRIYWTSRIEIETEAGRNLSEGPEASTPTQPPGKAIQQGQQPISVGSLMRNPLWMEALQKSIRKFQEQTEHGGLAQGLWDLYNPEKVGKVLMYKGRDVYEILWSTEVTVARELKKPVIEDIKHVEIKWEAIATA